MSLFTVRSAALGHHGETKVCGDVIELDDAVAADPAIAPHVIRVVDVPVVPPPVVITPDPPKKIAVVLPARVVADSPQAETTHESKE